MTAESPIDTIRRAAALIRQRAEAATAGTWQVESDGAGTLWVQTTMAPIACAGDEADPSVAADAEHVASWHPAVALAVAEAFAHQADDMDDYGAVEKPLERVDGTFTTVVKDESGGYRFDWDATLGAARAYLGVNGSDDAHT